MSSQSSSISFFKPNKSLFNLLYLAKIKGIKMLETTLSPHSNGAVEDFFAFVTSKQDWGKPKSFLLQPKSLWSQFWILLLLFKRTHPAQKNHTFSFVANEFPFYDFISVGFDITQTHFEWPRKSIKGERHSCFLIRELCQYQNQKYVQKFRSRL